MDWAGDFYKDNKRVFYSGMEKEHKYGVGLILDSYFSKAVLSFWPKSERILLVKLKASPFNVNIIVVYATTAEAEDIDIDNFYSSLDEVYTYCKLAEMTIVMGNWNAKLGSEEQGKSVGPFSLGERNERGDRLADWCVENRLVETNTWFKSHPRRQYTWKSPGDKAIRSTSS